MDRFARPLLLPSGMLKSRWRGGAVTRVEAARLDSIMARRI